MAQRVVRASAQIYSKFTAKLELDGGMSMWYDTLDSGKFPPDKYPRWVKLPPNVAEEPIQQMAGHRRKRLTVHVIRQMIRCINDQERATRGNHGMHKHWARVVDLDEQVIAEIANFVNPSIQPEADEGESADDSSPAGPSTGVGAGSHAPHVKTDSDIYDSISNGIDENNKAFLTYVATSGQESVAEYLEPSVVKSIWYAVAVKLLSPAQVHALAVSKLGRPLSNLSGSIIHQMVLYLFDKELASSTYLKPPADDPWFNVMMPDEQVKATFDALAKGIEPDGKLVFWEEYERLPEDKKLIATIRHRAFSYGTGKPGPRDEMAAFLWREPHDTWDVDVEDVKSDNDTRRFNKYFINDDRIKLINVDKEVIKD